MEPNEVKLLIEAGISGCTAEVTADGNKYTAVVTADVFAGKSLLEKQKMVYATVNEQIKNGVIHALTIKAGTEEEMT